MTLWNGPERLGSLGVLVNYLSQIPSLRDPGGRRLCLELLADRLGVPLTVADLPIARTHLIGIVQACRKQHPRALIVFIEVLEQMEPGSLPVRQARAVIEDMTALDLVSARDRHELLTLISSGTIDRLADFVLAAAGSEIKLAAAHHGPSEAVATLERLNARPDGVPPLLLFVEYLAAYTDDRRAELLRRWNDRQAERMGLTEKVLAVRCEQAVVPAQQEDVTAYLVIRIEPDLLDPNVFAAVHWRHSDAAGWRPRRGEPFIGELDALREHVAALVVEAETHWAKNAAAIRIEFLLPYALLNLPVDQWDLEAGSGLPRPIGLHYQVVLRSLDRARSPRWHREWRRRWELLQQLATRRMSAAQHWLWSEGAKPRHLTALDAKLAVRKEVVSLVLRTAPDVGGLGEVVVGVRGGVPVMIWHRAETARSAFEAEVKAMRDALPELAEHLRFLRSRAKQAVRPESHVGNRVSLIWDDPDRPVEPQEPPAAPSEEVAAS